MNMPTLQNIIDNDIKHRFILNYDPTKGDDCWWIRFKRWDVCANHLPCFDDPHILMRT